MSHKRHSGAVYVRHRPKRCVQSAVSVYIGASLSSVQSVGHTNCTVLDLSRKPVRCKLETADVWFERRQSISADGAC